MRFLLSLALFGLQLSSSGSTEPKQNPKPDELPPVDKSFEPHDYSGRVTAVSEEAVTIKPEGFVRIDEIKVLPDGVTQQRKVYIQDNTKPPRTFVFTDGALLTNGTLPAARRAGPPIAVRVPYRQHKISDLQPGDFVQISCGQSKGVYFCSEIEIHRRPGGQVPPAIGDDKLPVSKRVSTQRNAAQEQEVKIVRTLLQTIRLRP